MGKTWGKIISWLEKVVEGIESAPLSFPAWLMAFGALIAARLLVENWLADFQNRSALYFFYEFSHTFLFFLLAYGALLRLIIWGAQVEIKRAANVLLYGFLVILTPPILDYVISEGQGYWSFYDFGGLADLWRYFFAFFDGSPEIGITYGVRIEVAVAVLALGFYVLLKTRCWRRALATMFASYATFFLLGTLPSYPAIIIRGFSEGVMSVGSGMVAEMFLSPARIFSREVPEILSSLNIKMSLLYAPILAGGSMAFLWRYEKDKSKAMIRNMRLPQIIYHIGLLTLGMLLAVKIGKGVIVFGLFDVLAYLDLILAITAAWMASVVVNDIHDLEIDKTTNADRPLPQGVIRPGEYKILGAVFFGASLYLAAIVNPKAALLLVAYQAIAWLYSAWPLRLKRLTLVSTFVSALASLQIFFLGYVEVAANQSLHSLPFSLIVLLLVALTFSLSLKDFKDIEGDCKEGVRTIPVVLGEDWGRLIVGGGIFFSYLLSVAVFNEFKLFLWAIVFGGLSFWLMINKKIHPRAMFWWIMMPVVAYVAIIGLMVF